MYVWSEIGSGFGEPSDIPPSAIPKSIPHGYKPPVASKLIYESEHDLRSRMNNQSGY